MKTGVVLQKHALMGMLLVLPLASFTGRVDAQTVQVRGMDHVGLNVPDMDAAIGFFSATFGFTPVTQMRDLKVDSAFKKLYDMHESASVKRIVMLRAGNGANIELFQYESPDATKQEPHYDDAGEAHVAFYTDDMNRSVAALRAKGVKVLNDPIVMTQGPTAGESWTYFLTPWGSKIELVSYPDGEAYETQANTAHLWTPLPSVVSSNVTIARVQPLVDGYLQLFNETDASKRLIGLRKYFTSDIAFLDPEGTSEGIDHLNDSISKLQSQNPAWRFKLRAKIEVTANSARVAWQYGPESDSNKILGEDVLQLRDGKVASLVAFVGR